MYVYVYKDKEPSRVQDHLMILFWSYGASFQAVCAGADLTLEKRSETKKFKPPEDEDVNTKPIKVYEDVETKDFKPPVKTSNWNI